MRGIYTGIKGNKLDNIIKTRPLTNCLICEIGKDNNINSIYCK